MNYKSQALEIQVPDFYLYTIYLWRYIQVYYIKDTGHIDLSYDPYLLYDIIVMLYSSLCRLQ